jgi:Ankyrin repeats (3 copies)
MPPFHLVPMLFSSWRVRGRRSVALTDPPSDQDNDLEECDDILMLPEKYRNIDLDNVSSTEDDADESLEDWWQQQLQLTPTTTTTATTALSSPDALPAFTTLPCHVHNDAIFDYPERKGDEIESVTSRVSLERMKVIPFVALHLEQTSLQSDESSVASSDVDDEQSVHWKSIISMALDRDQSSHASLERQRGDTQTPGVVNTPSTVASPSSCSSGRMRTIPLRSILGNTNRETVAHMLSLGHHSSLHLGPVIPTVLVLPQNAMQNTGIGTGTCHSSGILWDPARPLLFGDSAKDGLDWESHALAVPSTFSESCRVMLELIATTSRDDRMLTLVGQTPELCLVRFRINHSTQLLLHWCCRQLWLEGVQKCYHATPEVIGIAVEGVVPLHVAVVAAGDARDDAPEAIELVDFLCKRYPEALRQTNKKLQTPLHLAVSTPFLNETLIQRLLKGYPTAAQLADEQGWTPAHYVCQSRRTDGIAARVLSLILRHSPSSADAVTRNLEKPIHIAARNNADDVIQILLESETASYELNAGEAVLHDA